MSRGLVMATAATGLLLAVAGGLAGLALRLVDPVPIASTTFGFGESGMVGFTVLGIAWASVGALLMTRRPENAIGWVMLVVGFGYSLSVLAGAATFSAVAADDRGLAQIAAWWAVAFSSLGQLTLYLGFIFPTGRGHTPGWDKVGRGFLVAMAVIFTWLLIQPGPLHLFSDIDNPFGVGPDLRGLLGPTPALTVVAMGMTFTPVLVAALISRYRMADPVQRVQIRWVTAAIALSLATLMVTAVVAIASRQAPEAPLTAYAVAGTAVPIAIGIAILRHHLYDIDRIISRTLSWAIVSGILVVVFAAGLVGLQALLTGYTQGRTLAVAASTLIAFALFQPVRRRVQRAVDRRFDRTRYDGERTVEIFAERLRGELDLDALATEIGHVVDQTVRPASAEIWLRSVPDRAGAAGP